MGKIGDYTPTGYNRVNAAKPKENPDDIFGILPKARHEQYDMKEIIKRIVDDSEFDEYKAAGSPAVTAFHNLYMNMNITINININIKHI